MEMSVCGVLCAAFLFIVVVTAEETGGISRCLIDMKSWGTSDPENEKSGYLKINQQTIVDTSDVSEDFKRGVYLAVIDTQDSCTVSDMTTFDITDTIDEARALNAYVKALKIGTVMVAFTAGELTRANVKTSLVTLESIGFNSIKSLEDGWEFAFVAVIGFPEKTQSSLQPAAVDGLNLVVEILANQLSTAVDCDMEKSATVAAKCLEGTLTLVSITDSSCRLATKKHTKIYKLQVSAVNADGRPVQKVIDAEEDLPTNVIVCYQLPSMRSVHRDDDLSKEITLHRQLEI